MTKASAGVVEAGARMRGKGIAGSRPSGRSLFDNAIVARVARLGAGASLSLGGRSSNSGPARGVDRTCFFVVAAVIWCARWLPGTAQRCSCGGARRNFVPVDDDPGVWSFVRGTRFPVHRRVPWRHEHRTPTRVALSGVLSIQTDRGECVAGWSDRPGSAKPMSRYVLAHEADDAERQRMALLHAFHGPLTLTRLAAADIRAGWRCLEVGAGSGGMTAWLARRVAPTGRVVAVDLETHWLEPLRSEIVEVRQADITTIELPSGELRSRAGADASASPPRPAADVSPAISGVVAGGHLIVHDADFTPVALQGASELEAAGIAAMASTMRAGGVHMAPDPGSRSFYGRPGLGSLTSSQSRRRSAAAGHRR